MMRLPLITSLALILFALGASCQEKNKNIDTEVLIIGGGASGTMAGIQCARMGVETIIIEKTPWLGGMLTSAGVSAIDGNHKLPSGLWGEFRKELYEHYGGPEAVETGWVSNCLFEPSVGNQILKRMADLPGLQTIHGAVFQSIEKLSYGWSVVYRDSTNSQREVSAKIVIDASELGDVLAKAGVRYSIGMDDKTVDEYAPEVPNDIIQDLTYVAILQDFGSDADKTIPKPEGYDPSEFECSCNTGDKKTDGVDCETMLNYGKLPNGKYMINWPNCGNDIYLNIIEDTREVRSRKLEEAKLHTLRFIYYVQTELGYKNLGLAANEFDTEDNLPYIPYHRESRRIKGKALLRVKHLEAPFDQDEAYYRTGVAVGDYPIDHHHKKNPNAPDIDFINIKVPSYNLPAGSLIPDTVNDFIVAEKSVGVSNIVNGTTRLQPVVMGIGQAAGALAALCVKEDLSPAEVSIRKLQQCLIESGAYIMPYIDVTADHPQFESIQRVGATGILKGSGVPYKWANQTWFYPEDNISEYDLIKGLRSYYFDQLQSVTASGEKVSTGFLVEVVAKIKDQKMETIIINLTGNSTDFDPDKILNRAEIAHMIDKLLNPFAIPIDFDGKIKSNKRP